MSPFVSDTSILPAVGAGLLPLAVVNLVVALSIFCRPFVADPVLNIVAPATTIAERPVRHRHPFVAALAGPLHDHLQEFPNWLGRMGGRRGGRRGVAAASGLAWTRRAIQPVVGLARSLPPPRDASQIRAVASSEISLNTLAKFLPLLDGSCRWVRYALLLFPFVPNL